MDRSDIGDDILDLRDVCDLRRELIEQLKEDAENNVIGPDHDDDVEALEWINELESDLGESLDIYAENESTLILEGYFVEYAEQFADDIGAIDSNASWPLNHIDWEAAADELKVDYTEVMLGGYTYLIRNY